MKHYASPRFWTLYRALPEDIRKIADKNFELIKVNPRHPSLHSKRIGELWSVRVGAQYRALGIDVEGGIYWIWIGTHADYDKARKKLGSEYNFIHERLDGVFPWLQQNW